MNISSTSRYSNVAQRFLATVATAGLVVALLAALPVPVGAAETDGVRRHEGARQQQRHSGKKNADAQSQSPDAVRCAVIGGMMDTGFWPALCERFTAATGKEVVVVSYGPKHRIADAFTAGKADLIAMHACDTIINLVADGLAENPQPWARNDLLLVGPANDPAGISGTKDAADAISKLVQGGYPIFIHRSHGAQTVLMDICEAAKLKIDPSQVISEPVDDDRRFLEIARENGAYTIVGRIPFRNNKIDNAGLKVMVEGDPRLRRPYMVATAVPNDENGERVEVARALAAFLRTPDTQNWIAQFGRGQLDDRPVFFPVVLPPNDR